MTVVSFSMAYRSFRGGSGRLHTRLDTPPLINRRHPDSCLALHTLRDARRNCPAPEAVAGKRRRVKPGEAGPGLDDQCDRIGVDRAGTNPVAVGYRLSPCTPWNTWRRQA